MTAEVGVRSARSKRVSIAMKHGLPEKAATRHALTAYVTFVALDGRALPVPALRPETPADVARFREGELRRQFRVRLADGQLPTMEEATAAAGPQGRGALVRELLKALPESLYGGTLMRWIETTPPLRPRLPRRARRWCTPTASS